MPSSYRQTLADLYALEAKKGMDFRLSRLDPVLDALGHPEAAFACVHVAGTNGKGSTSAMIEGALRAGGHRTGLYTSPHLVSFRERIRCGGVPITRDAVVARVDAVRAAMRKAGADLTFFEIATLAAFVEFRERGVEVVVLEAGLGGRLDVTNVARGDVAVITSVGIDHAEFLGSTIGEIAREKAAIIKSGSVAVSGLVDDEASAVVAARAAEVGAVHVAYGRDFGDFAPLVAAQARLAAGSRAGGGAPEGGGAAASYGVSEGGGVSEGDGATGGDSAAAGDGGAEGGGAAARDGDRAEVRSGVRERVLAGRHQARNAAVAAAAVAALAGRFPVADDDRDRGILGVRWPGRLEVLPRRRGDGALVLDAAHNPEAAAALAAAVGAVAPGRPRVLVFAAMADKDWPSMLAALAPHFDRVIFAPLAMPRAEDPRRFLVAVPDATVAASAAEALALAEDAASLHGSIVVAGSIFLLGNLYRSAGGTLLEDDLAD